VADPRIPGRMIRRSIATDKGVAKLTAEQTAIFCMLIPHYDSYGKLIGEPAYVKSVALPSAKWATIPVIERALRAINRHTSVKWFRGDDGRRYLHVQHFEKHQELRADRRGIDYLPSYGGAKPNLRKSRASKIFSPGLSPDLVPPEVKEKLIKGEEEYKPDFGGGGIGNFEAPVPAVSPEEIPTDKSEELEEILKRFPTAAVKRTKYLESKGYKFDDGSMTPINASGSHE